MFVHLIALQELKAHSETYWLPGRDHSAPCDTWVVLSEVESGYATTVIELAAGAGGPEDALAQFLNL